MPDLSRQTHLDKLDAGDIFRYTCLDWLDTGDTFGFYETYGRHFDTEETGSLVVTSGSFSMRLS